MSTRSQYFSVILCCNSKETNQHVLLPCHDLVLYCLFIQYKQINLDSEKKYAKNIGNNNCNTNHKHLEKSMYSDGIFNRICDTIKHFHVIKM